MIQFGTDGIRGRAGQSPCTTEVALALGRVLAEFAGGAGRRVLVLRDTRPSGPALEWAICQGVSLGGATALQGGVLPTAALSVGLLHQLAEVGVMVTASHNEALDNGFKVFAAGGKKLSDSQSAWFEERLHSALQSPVVAELSPKRGSCEGSLRDLYQEALSGAVPDRSVFIGKKLGIDLANGAASPLRDWLGEWLGAELIVVGGGDGLINHEVGSQCPGALAAAIRLQGLDGGIAVDGDADRCVLLDERGRVVSGDGLTWLLATSLKVQRLAVTVMSNAALEPALPGVSVIRTSVGDKHLARALDAKQATLGCEESGHVLFADGLPTGDGLFTGLRALGLVFSGASTLSERLRPFQPFPRVLGKMSVSGRPPLDQLPELSRALHDGERELGADGRIYLRYSGTEPVLRVLVEGRDEVIVQRVYERVSQVAKDCLQ